MARRKKQIRIPKIVLMLIFIAVIIVVIVMCKNILQKNKNKNNNNLNTNVELNTSNYKDYELPVAYYYNGIQNKNFETFIKAYPDFMQIGSQFSAEDLNNYYEQNKDVCGENITLSYEIGDAISYSANEIENLKADFKTNYGINVDLSEAYSVNVKVKYSGDKSSIESNRKHTVFKYNGQWYSL